eukprot:TRINITY_DN12116_c0_g1_i1.p1 TRINITY_DN12116_c0_g1~~TRINITY_DN12116_c0_g1_i1.p1  ORF type:complete len:209 (-),score=13.19 TRINITY_DN12116_c0_g1_i1:6-632(-)
METSVNTLHATIKAKNTNDLKLLLASMSPLELRTALQERVDGSTAIELAFRINKNISITLANSIISAKNQQKIEAAAADPRYRYRDVCQIFIIWRLMFMTFKYYFMALKNDRRISSKELATKMIFLKPGIDRLDLKNFSDREGFIKLALLLGAKHDPQGLCSLILFEIRIQKRRKEKLVDWLIDNNFLNKEMQPFTISDYSRAIKNGY